jgi:hypothetical protein
VTNLQLKVIHHANDILQLWHNLSKEADKSDKPAWYKIDMRQAYQDALISMVRNGLIEQYDVVRVRVKVDGVWSDSRRHLQFVEHSNEELMK